MSLDLYIIITYMYIVLFTGIARVSEELKNNERHAKYLAKIPLHQLERLVTIIQVKINFNFLFILAE